MLFIYSNYSMQVWQDRDQLLLYSHIVALLLARHCILFLSLKYPSWLMENQLMRQLQPKQGFTGLLTNHEAYFWNPLYFISIYTHKSKVDIHNISSLLHYSLIISLVLVEGGELVLAPLSSMSSYATRFACLVLCQERPFYGIRNTSSCQLDVPIGCHLSSSEESRGTRHLSTSLCWIYTRVI